MRKLMQLEWLWCGERQVKDGRGHLTWGWKLTRTKTFTISFKLLKDFSLLNHFDKIWSMLDLWWCKSENKKFLQCPTLRLKIQNSSHASQNFFWFSFSSENLSWTFQSPLLVVYLPSAAIRLPFAPPFIEPLINSTLLKVSYFILKSRFNAVQMIQQKEKIFLKLTAIVKKHFFMLHHLFFSRRRYECLCK